MRSCKFFSMMLAVVLATSCNLFADAIVDDCEGGTNQDKFGYYWYFYDDFKDGGSSTIPGLTKDASGSFPVVPSAAAGHVGLGIALPYSLGPTKAGSGAGYNYIGMGAMLCGNGKTIDLSTPTAATKCSFWLKCDKAITVDFMIVDSVNVKDYGYYHALCPIAAANTWQQFNIDMATGLTGLIQPTWAKAATFSLKTISKLQWQIHNENVGTNITGTVDIDDIVLAGYTFVPPDRCDACVSTAGTVPAPAALLSNMETPPLNQNARGYYWFFYTDEKARTSPAPSEISAVTGGMTTADPPTILIGPTWPKGYNASNGADIVFTLGKKFAKTGSTDPIKPFVGVGTNLWNELTTSDTYNASTDGHTGIYFDYTFNASDPSAVLRLEVYAQDLGVDGAVHYINLPATGATVWKGAKVLFSNLVLPDWQGIVPGTAIDLTKLKKFQWAVQAGEGVTGEIGIDNVYLTGGTKITSNSAVKYQAVRLAAAEGFASSMANNTLKITLNKGMSNGSISLVNTKGAIVAHGVAAKNMIANVNVTGLAKGVYMLTVKANTKAGAGYSKTMPITVY